VPSRQQHLHKAIVAGIGAEAPLCGFAI
jgi:hypothetical protein